MPYFEIPGGLPQSASRMTEAMLTRHIRAAALRQGMRVRADADSAPFLPGPVDAVAADYWTGMLEDAGIKKPRDLRADSRDDRRIIEANLPAMNAYLRSLGRPEVRADAAIAAPEALTTIYGAPIHRPVVPRVLADPTNGIPVRGIDPWADTVRIDFVTHAGMGHWGRGGDSTMGRSDYDMEFEYRPVHMWWTSTATEWYQGSIVSQAPLVNVSPQAERATAARQVAEKALEDAIVSGVVGLDMWSLQTVPALRSTSSLTYGTDPIESTMVDFRAFLQYVSEASKTTFQVDTIAMSERIKNRLILPTTTFTGYPWNTMEQFEETLREYGITKVIYAPSLQDFGGSLVDGAVAFNRDASGLKRIQAMAFSPVRTVAEGLSDVTYYVMRHAGLYAPFAGSTYIYEIPVSAA